jgi:hypothetical protein
LRPFHATHRYPMKHYPYQWLLCVYSDTKLSACTQALSLSLTNGC